MVHLAVENTATYDKDFENGDRIQAIFGYSALYGNYQNIGTYRDSLNSTDPELAFLDNSLNFNEQAPKRRIGRAPTCPALPGIRARRPLLPLHHPPGSSSKFGANNRYGILLSAAWNLTEIPWVVEKDWIEFAKVRASWAQRKRRRHRQLRLHLRVFNGQDHMFGPSRCRSMAPAPSPRPTRT